MKILLFALMLFLVGCTSIQEKVVTVREPVVVMPPESMFNCPDAPVLPSPGTTDVAVADYILRLYQSGRLCRESLGDVKQFLIDAKKIAEEEDE